MEWALYTCEVVVTALRRSIAAPSILWLPPLGGSVNLACDAPVSMLGSPKAFQAPLCKTGVVPPMRPGHTMGRRLYSSGIRPASRA